MAADSIYKLDHGKGVGALSHQMTLQTRHVAAGQCTISRNAPSAERRRSPWEFPLSPIAF